MSGKGKATEQSVVEVLQSAEKWLEDEANQETILDLRREMRVASMKSSINEMIAQNELYEKRKPVLEKIPGFWAMAISRHQRLAMFTANPGDQTALSYLTSIDLKRATGPVTAAGVVDYRNYELIFTFSENPYFTNKTLTKSYTLAEEAASSSANADALLDDLLEFDDTLLAGSVTTIDWKDEAHDLIKEAAKDAVTGEADDEDDILDPGSFFALFTKEEDDFNVGAIFRDELIPSAPEYFAGLVEDSDDDGEGGMFYDEDDEDDEDDEEDEIDLEEDLPPKKKSKK